MFEKDNITVLVPTSPIPSHPSTEVIEHCINDIRAVLPQSEILIMIDGVRNEQEERKADYQEYTRRLLWLCNFQWKNVLPILFKDHQHQSGTARYTLEKVKTPTILYVEHDAPLTPDFDFPWVDLVNAIKDGTADVIRFHFEAQVHPEHQYLMLDSETRFMGENNLPMRRTAQWSQRPHLANTAWYKKMMADNFTDESRTMIEDLYHGKVMQAFHNEGEMGWLAECRLWMYHPETGNIKRSYHLDARGNDPKYDMRF